MRYERHVTILGLGGAKCDGCQRELRILERVLSTPDGEADVQFLCGGCAKALLEKEKADELR